MEGLVSALGAIGKSWPEWEVALGTFLIAVAKHLMGSTIGEEQFYLVHPGEGGGGRNMRYPITHVHLRKQRETNSGLQLCSLLLFRLG